MISLGWQVNDLAGQLVRAVSEELNTPINHKRTANPWAVRPVISDQHLRRKA